MEIGAGAMFDASDLSDELLGFKGEVSHLLNTKGEGLFEASRDRTEALADQIKAALNDLAKTLSEQEDHCENFISDRPVTSLASAFALGIVVGFILRSH